MLCLSSGVAGMRWLLRGLQPDPLSVGTISAFAWLAEASAGVCAARDLDAGWRECADGCERARLDEGAGTGQHLEGSHCVACVLELLSER